MSYVGDHIFGLIPLLAGCLNGMGGTSDGVDDPRIQVDTAQPVCASDISFVTGVYSSESITTAPRDLWPARNACLRTRWSGIHVLASWKAIRGA